MNSQFLGLLGAVKDLKLNPLDNDIFTVSWNPPSMLEGVAIYYKIKVSLEVENATLFDISFDVQNTMENLSLINKAGRCIVSVQPVSAAGKGIPESLLIQLSSSISTSQGIFKPYRCSALSRNS